MLPLLHPGALIMVDERAYARREPRRGEVVAVRPDALHGTAVVKRIAECVSDDAFLLQGDHAADSLDSRTLGPVRLDELIGPVWLQVWPLKRFP